jgi:predicted NAD/FAD-binding protein
LYASSSARTRFFECFRVASFQRALRKIGSSGATGLAAAFQAVRDGHDVTVLEADTQAGRMAAHFDFDGLSIERFYRFICKTNYPTFARAGSELVSAIELIAVVIPSYAINSP